MPHQVRSHIRHAPEPSSAFAAKIQRFKRGYGAPPETTEDAFFEFLKESNIVAERGRIIPGDDFLRETAKELAEELDEEVQEWSDEYDRKHPRPPRDPEFEAEIERLHLWHASEWLPKELEDRLDNLERNLDRKRTEQGRQREINRVKSLIHEYERELGRGV
jgi:hypothetical protein